MNFMECSLRHFILKFMLNQTEQCRWRDRRFEFVELNYHTDELRFSFSDVFPIVFLFLIIFQVVGWVLLKLIYLLGRVTRQRRWTPLSNQWWVKFVLLGHVFQRSDCLLSTWSVSTACVFLFVPVVFGCVVGEDVGTGADVGAGLRTNTEVGGCARWARECVCDWMEGRTWSWICVYTHVCVQTVDVYVLIREGAGKEVQLTGRTRKLGTRMSFEQFPSRLFQRHLLNYQYGSMIGSAFTSRWTVLLGTIWDASWRHDSQNLYSGKSVRHLRHFSGRNDAIHRHHVIMKMCRYVRIYMWECIPVSSYRRWHTR